MAGKAASGAGTIRKKTVSRKGKDYTYWEARVTVGHDPGTGKQIQRSFTGKTQKEVREKMQSASVLLNEGSYAEPSKMKLSQWLDIWIDEYTGDKKYSTIKQYKAQVRTHIKPMLGAVKLSQLAPHMIQKCYNELLQTGRTVGTKGEKETKQMPLSAKSVRNIHGVLTKALSVAVSIGYLRSNPAERVTLPRAERKEIHPLTDEQIKLFLSAASNDEYRYLLKLIPFTGLRESEAIGLTWDCIDFKKGTIKVCKQLQKRPLADGGFTFTPLKNDKARIIKPAPFVMTLLEERRKEQIMHRLQAGEAWCGWKTEGERKNALVFTSLEGKNLHPQTVYNHYKKIASRIGAGNTCVHDLRHTFAVLSLQNGDDVKTVQSNLGHATAAFTLDVYGHVSERMKEESAARMEAYIKEVSAR